MNKRKIIIDCDPGQDDAVMLLLALACPAAFDILGITTVAGNTTPSAEFNILEDPDAAHIVMHCGQPMPTGYTRWTQMVFSHY